MKIKRIRMNGLRLERQRKDIVTCNSCGRILAILRRKACPHLYLQLFCECGENGYCIIGDVTEAEGAADKVENRIYCNACGLELFALTDNVRSSCFVASCVCGKQYDRVYVRKREVYKELSEELKKRI